MVINVSFTGDRSCDTAWHRASLLVLTLLKILVSGATTDWYYVVLSRALTVTSTYDYYW